MQRIAIAIALSLVVPLAVAGQQGVYKWEDDEGNVFYSDHPPPEAADYPKDIKNEHGVTVNTLDGKKTEEQLQAEREAEERARQEELRLRADRALLATYQTVDEIEMHRDRRVELFQAQSRVTELYIRNLRRRLAQLNSDALRYRPYSSDPGAPMIDPELVEDIKATEGTIDRHEANLIKYQNDEQEIRNQFKGDIDRFRTLKGITMTAAQAVPE